jgi:hypothetical protein
MSQKQKPRGDLERALLRKIRGQVLFQTSRMTPAQQSSVLRILEALDLGQIIRDALAKQEGGGSTRRGAGEGPID